VNSNYLDQKKKANLEKSLWEQRRKQPGVAFPSALTQEHLLIIRFNISYPIADRKDKEFIRNGVTRLCKFFDRIDKGKIKIDDLTNEGETRIVPLSEFNFSATIGFGMGFFEKLKIDSPNRPKKLKEMPNHIGLGDPRPYSIFQTDFIIQLGSDTEDINRWVFQHSSAKTEQVETMKGAALPSYLSQYKGDGTDDGDIDIFSCISEWAATTDVHTGFQRIDGRNLMGFNDGISNPKRLSNDVIWTIAEDENQKFADGTYMVFQKIGHDLDMWRNLTVEKQEKWVGRSKGTGLLLGTLPKDLDRKLASDLHSEQQIVRNKARKQWKKLYYEQNDPDKRFFDPHNTQYRNIQLQCPVWSHVRKSNPRQADGAARSLIFRRGYLFSEGGQSGVFNSGLLFICFQRDIKKGFEYIKKNFLNNEKFPVPDQRKNFRPEELARGHHYGRFPSFELRKEHISYSNSLLNSSYGAESQNTGREGLSGPSELGVFPDGQFIATIPVGGGYYFIPPIPNRKISDIGEQFFA
jgi:Dyp-type peroxidase family